MLFFFKQKRAYDVRISDWSSDVCSSDLFAVLGNAAVELAVADVGAVAAVEDLDVAAVELLDDSVAGDLFLFLDQEHRVREVDGVRVVFLLQRRIYAAPFGKGPETARSEEHPSELQSLMRISYAVFCLKKKKQ